MENINNKKIEVEIVETNTIKAEISIQEIKDVMFEELHDVLDNLNIYHDKPCMDYSDNGDSVEVYVSGLDDYMSASDVVDSLEESFEKAFTKYIKKISQESQESKEEGENGSL